MTTQINRRFFLRSGAAVAALASFPLLECEPEKSGGIVAELVRLNDVRLLKWRQQQQLGLDSDCIGALQDPYGIPSPGLTAAFIRDAICALVSPQSRFYKSPQLQQSLFYATNYLLHAQHEDGTIDLPSTNFHSPPDTGFVLEWICTAGEVLKQHGPSELDSTLQLLESFVLRAAAALVKGGIHSPNHRWVVSMALARAYSLFPKQMYIDRLDRWLTEHIDIDADGQFTEKSSSIYSPLTDRCLITMARLLNRLELYEPVRKNLAMTEYYVHPNGEVVTEASKRQDQYKYGSMAPYYYPYRYMALLDHNGRFSAMAQWIERLNRTKLVSNLVYFLEDSGLAAELPSAAPLPVSYSKVFQHSDLARIRRGNTSATILAKNFTFFSFRNGEAILQAVRFASAFFGKGQFEGEALQVVEGKFVLTQELEGPYYQPYPEKEIPEDGDWEKMDKEKRPKSNVQHLKSTVTLAEQNGQFELEFDVRGTDDVPLAIELAFRHGGKLYGVEKVLDIKDAWFLKEKMGRYAYEDQIIEFGPGCHAHGWTQLRGAEDKLDAQCVYLTAFTPFEWRISLRPVEKL